ncbi:hypothetical protein [Pyrococcus kukulkanii]|uniref:hypothetical protein n=1 Tax=Pyrococcus kukulkanii TaxID=1609559 RepID=UPI0035671B45
MPIVKTITIMIPDDIDEETFKRIVEGIARRLIISKRRLEELNKILKNSELTDEDAIELGRLVKKRAREKGWY